MEQDSLYDYYYLTTITNTTTSPSTTTTTNTFKTLYRYHIVPKVYLKPNLDSSFYTQTHDFTPRNSMY